MAKKTPSTSTPPALTLTDARLIAQIIRGDGHTIFKPTAFTLRGVNAAFIDAYTNTYHSDGTLKGSITDAATGAPLDSLRGVYGLPLLWAVARRINADTSAAASMMGRGFQARALTTAILDATAGEPPTSYDLDHPKPESK